VAITLKVYATAVLKPVTVKGEEAPEAVLVPVVVQYAVYDEIAPPPTQDGAVNGTDIELVLACEAVPIVGASATFRALYPGKTIPA
jgi:hypothetical protein